MDVPAPPTMVEIDPRFDPRWQHLQSHGGSLFTTPAWITAVTATYELRPSARLAVEPDGSVLAGVAYCELHDLRGHRLVSFPFSDFQEPLGASRADVGALLDSFLEGPPATFEVPQHRMPDSELVARFERRADLLQHRIEIDPETDAEKRFSDLHPKVRQNIRRSRRGGVEIELSSDLDALREFYDLHVRVRARKYRLLPQPFEFMKQIHAAFAQNGELTVALARLNGRAIAGVVYLEAGGTLYYKFNASDADQLDVRPNEDLVWAGLEHCVDRGLTGIDLGVSNMDQDGLLRYKRKLADAEQVVVTLRTPGFGSLNEEGPAAEAAALFPELTAILTDERMPLDLVEHAGSMLYRYFA